VVGTAQEMILHHLVYSGPGKDSGFPNRSLIHRVKQEGLKDRAKPMVRRDIKTLLRTLQYAFWYLS